MALPSDCIAGVSNAAYSYRYALQVVVAARVYVRLSACAVGTRKGCESYGACYSQVFKNPADGKWLLIGQPFELGGRDHKVSSHAHYRVRAPPPFRLFRITPIRCVRAKYAHIVPSGQAGSVVRF